MARTATRTRGISYDKERNKYIVTYEHGKDENDKRIRSYKSFASYEEAKLAKAQFDIDKANGEVVNKKNITLSGLLDEWIISLEVADRAVTTIRGYENIIRHIKPILGNKKLTELKAEDITRYYAYKMSGDKELGIAPFSNNTIRSHNTLLKTALNFAIKREILKNNIVKNIEVPKYVMPEIDFYETKDLSILLDKCKDTEIAPAIYIAAYLGLRREEVAALKWSDFDFEKKEVSISKAITKMYKNDALTPKNTKTKASERKLFLPNDLVEVLEQIKKNQLNDKMNFGDAYNESGYVNVDALGEFIAPDKLTVKLKKLINKEKLKPIHFRGLRHTVASIANNEGVTIYNISRMLGHSNINTTATKYTKLFKENNEVAASAIGDAIARVKGTN